MLRGLQMGDSGDGVIIPARRGKKERVIPTDFLTQLAMCDLDERDLAGLNMFNHYNKDYVIEEFPGVDALIGADLQGKSILFQKDDFGDVFWTVTSGYVTAEVIESEPQLVLLPGVQTFKDKLDEYPDNNELIPYDLVDSLAAVGYDTKAVFNAVSYAPAPYDTCWVLTPRSA